MNKLIHGPNIAGQSLADRVAAAKHSIAGQGLAKSVCKATTEEVLGPKKKHLDYLLQCTNEPNVSIPQLANLLIERTQNSNWVVVYKGLVTIHNLMNYGNERFTQYLASNNCTFNLSAFLDKGGVQGYDMSTYIRRYAKYLNEKAYSYRTMAFDFCKVKRGKDDGLLRTMNTEKLLKSLPVLQQQVDALLEFDVTPNELTNGVINACFMLLFKDLIRLFACYNDGIINLLEKFFEMNKKNCREALDVYKKFLVRMERTAEFLKVCESVGIDKGDIPDLAKAPSSLLEALEEHLKSLESAKKSGQPAPKPAAKVTSEINTFAAAATSGVNAAVISDEEKMKIIAEEEKQLEQLKERNLKEKSSPTDSVGAAASNPFSSPSASNANVQKQDSVDLFGAGSPTHTANAATNNSTVRPSDDLFDLGGGNTGATQAPNPFAPAPGASNNPFAAPASTGASPWGQPTAAPGGAGGYLPAPIEPTSMSYAAAGPSGFDGFGDILTPMAGTAGGKGQVDNKLIGGDLDSSLASLAGNLSINPSQQVKKTEHQWGAGNAGGGKLTGPSAPGGGGVAWSGTQQAPAPQQQFNQPLGMGMPMMGAMPQAGFQQQQGMMGYQQPMGMGMAPRQPQPMGMGMAPMGFTQPPPSQQNPAGQQNQANDPFGAL